MRRLERIGFGIFIVLILAMLVYAYGGSDPAVHGHSSGEVELPSGAIIAFDGPCPSGWTEVANGRTIIGYSSGDGDFNTLGNTGGVKDVTLTTSQIPSHRHTTTYWKGGVPQTWSPSLVDVKHTDGGSTSRTLDGNYAGGGGSHENLPPYVVYRYCKKS